MSSFCPQCGAAYRDDDKFCAQCAEPRRAGASQLDPTPAPGSTGTRTGSAPPSVGALIGLAAMFAVGVPALLFGVGNCDADVAGQVAVREGPRPGFTFTPTGCASMQPYGRFGANLHGQGPNDGAVYVTRDPLAGDRVDLEIPGSCRQANGTECTLIPVPRDACRVFEVVIDFNGVVFNDVRLVEGHVALECTLPDGTQVRGRVSFDGC